MLLKGAGAFVVIFGDLFFDLSGPALPAGVTLTRASTATHWNAAQDLVSAAIDAPRFDHDPATGALLGLRKETWLAVNKCTGNNATGLLASQVSGSATVTVVDDSVALAAEGYDVVSDGNVYDVDNTGGGAWNANFDGTVGNTNGHSCGLVIRAVGGAAGGVNDRIGLGGDISSTSAPVSNASAYHLVTLEGVTPSVGTLPLRLQVDAGSHVRFLLQGLVEHASLGSLIPGAGATRQPDVLHFDVPDGTYATVTIAAAGGPYVANDLVVSGGAGYTLDPADFPGMPA